MADDNDTDDTNNSDDGDGGAAKETPRQLRTKLEATLTENAEMKGKLLIYESGLGHLTEKQRKAVVRDAAESGKELTPDLLKASAKDLGFPETLKTESESGSHGNQDRGDSGDGEGNDAMNTDALSGMDAIEQAQRRTVTTASEGSFADKMAKAGSQAEVEALIRSEGSKVGLVHEWDVD
jgi:hypothetical protein